MSAATAAELDLVRELAALQRQISAHRIRTLRQQVGSRPGPAFDEIRAALEARIKYCHAGPYFHHQMSEALDNLEAQAERLINARYYAGA